MVKLINTTLTINNDNKSIKSTIPESADVSTATLFASASSSEAAPTVTSKYEGGILTLTISYPESDGTPRTDTITVMEDKVYYESNYVKQVEDPESNIPTSPDTTTAKEDEEYYESNHTEQVTDPDKNEVDPNGSTKLPMILGIGAAVAFACAGIIALVLKKKK